MAPPLATESDLTDWLPDGTVVTDAPRLLARASQRIDSAVLAAFDIDIVTALPTDSTVAAALRDATCAQVEQWLEVGEENDIDGLAGTQIAVTGFSGKRAPRIAPRALDILRDAGLMNQGTHTSTGVLW